MHDLKNIVAQQAVLLDNAKRHRHREEFVDDMITTVDNSVSRMRKVLDQLGHGKPAASTVRVDANKIVHEVVNDCEDRQPQPLVEIGEPVWVQVDRERLRAALTHCIRNAQDASSEGGKVTVSVNREQERVNFRIADNGVGMTAEFLRTRLFKPFDSTKESRGMGIGAYQIREFATEMGGGVSVESEPGVGTVFTISLPALLSTA